MQIFLAKTMGFCNGVKRAVDLALKAGKGSYTLGPLIHNPQMVEKLKSQGIVKADSLYGIPPQSKVVFRSHGESPTSYTVAQNRALEVIDATCPNVKKVQEAVQSLSEEGYQVLIIGDPKHAEVISIKSWGGNKPVVVENEADLENLEPENKYGIVAQTTCVEEVFTKLCKLIEEKVKEVKVIHTICSATKDRQQATEELAKKVDVVLVIGGRNSANTRHLGEIAQMHCEKVYLLETAEELGEELLADCRAVGITAGASTPEWLINDVVKKMENLGEVFLGDGLRKLSQGDVIEGTVVSVNKDEALLDICYKSEGILPKSEYSLAVPEDLTTALQVGDKLQILVAKFDKEGNVTLSKVKADALTATDKLKEAQEKKEVLEITVTAAVKGGLSCSVCGVQGFVPASHVDIVRVEDLSLFVGQKLEAQILELDLESARKRIILSRRELLRQAKEAEEKARYSKIKIGEKYSGVVTRLAKFGAFVDIGGVEGLLHISDMSWQRLKEPTELLSIGDKVEVLVQKIDLDSKKISLNLRDLQQDPWLLQAEKLREGQLVEGTISKLAKFGAFLKIDEFLEGLVHVSEIAEEHVDNLEAVLQLGQRAKAKVLKIDKENKKLSLSIAQAKMEEEKEEFKEFLGDLSEFKNPIGSKFDLSKLFAN